MNWKQHISSDPEILQGKAVIKGTRVPADLILEKMSYGEGINQILEEYPHLSVDKIHACLAYAANFIQGEISYQNAS